MKFQYRYLGSSQVSQSPTSTQMQFAPDTQREPTYFRGQLSRHLPFREAMSALHQVVVSDMRFQPRDKSHYKDWLASQEAQFLAEATQKEGKIKDTLTGLKNQLSQLQSQEFDILKPYYEAQTRYFKYLYKNDYNAWFVLDPVITVHPDSVFFECFSQDESSYGKLSCQYEVFENIQEQACGTTNIDYSNELYLSFQKIRSYKNTDFVIDPSGFEVQTGESPAFKEAKIDLPDSWVRGFLQVSSAMSLPLTRFDLHPMDLYNLLLFLKRHKEKASPRSLRFCLTPGQPVEILIEPWNHRLKCPRSIFKGPQAQEIRIWGRRRLMILERLLPLIDTLSVSLLGSGMPSFWEAKMRGMTFTLGLSGWSANDFSQSGNFDLLAPQGEVDSPTAQTVFEALQSHWVTSAPNLARELNLDILTVKNALGIYAQSGRVLYDLEHDCYRIRELTKDPLPIEELRFANPREEKALNFVQAGLVSVTAEDTHSFEGEVYDNAKAYHPTLVLDADMRLVKGECQCHFFIQNHLRQGPCEHLLALRLARTKKEQPKAAQ